MAFAMLSFAEETNHLEDLERSGETYFSKHDYDGFYRYLQGLLEQTEYQKTPEVYYYLALTRHKQILYWQEIKNWEGLYDQSAGLKKEALRRLDEAQQYLGKDALLVLSIKYLRWRASQDAQGPGPDGLFADLIQTAKGLASSASLFKTMELMSDELGVLEDKSYSYRFYEIYAEKILESGLSAQELKSKAEMSLASSKVYLAKTLFEAYLRAWTGEDEQKAGEIAAVAGRFAHQDFSPGLDPLYAEAMYKKAFGLAGDSAFDSISRFRRAFNLERMKEYLSALIEYRALVNAYPETQGRQGVYFRMAVLAAFALKNINLAQEYFSIVGDESADNALGLSAFYHLGLLSQWKQDFDRAGEFYRLIRETAEKTGLSPAGNETVRAASERESEIEEKKEISYPLRLFLQGIFKMPSETKPAALNFDLTARPWKEKLSQPVTFVVSASTPQTGCMMPVYSYEWSGDTGSAAQLPNAPELTTEYPQAGIKVTHIAVVGPQGLEGVGFEMVEIDNG